MVRDDIDAYITDLRASKQIAENTEASYLRDLSKLAKYGDTLHVTELADMDASFLSDFISELKAESVSASTVTRMISCLHGFFGAMKNAGKIEEDPSRGIKAARAARGSRKKLPTKVMTNSDIRKLINEPNEEKPIGIRDRAMLSLIAFTGIRTSEIARLKIKDLDFLINYMTVHEDGGTKREVPFDNNTAEAVRAYLTAYQDQFEPRNDILFVNRDGSTLSRQGIWKMVKKYGRNAGIDGEVTPTRLRVSLQHHLLENSGYDASVSKILGGVGLNLSETKLARIRQDNGKTTLRAAYDKLNL